MKKLFFRFTPYIFTAVACAFSLGGFLLDKMAPDGLDVYLWSLVALCQAITCFMWGKLVQTLHTRANVDDLTGLGNRRHFNARLSEEIERVKRNNSRLSLLMIDVDGFKGINDRYGHQTGDEVLSDVAGVLSQNTRSIDTAARWGGEEFAVILPETAIDGALVIAERLRSIVEGRNFPCGATISVGIVSRSGDMDVDYLVSLADQALYEAKKRKNMVVIAPGPAQDVGFAGEGGSLRA